MRILHKGQEGCYDPRPGGMKMKVLYIIPVALILVLAMIGCGGGDENLLGTQVEPEGTPQATAEMPTPTAESKYDEAWARKQVEPVIEKGYEILLDHAWSRAYDLYSDEAREGCPRSMFVSKMAGNMLLASAFGFDDDYFKAELQDLKDGVLVITFQEITKDRITYTIEGDKEPTTIVRKNSEWVGEYEPLGQDCSSLDMATTPESQP
jgi:hypothetical protein